MYRKEKKETSLFKEYPWLWIVVIAFGFWIISKMCASGPDIKGAEFPGDNQYVEDAYIEEEIRGGRYDLEQIKSDPCLYDIYLGVPEGYRRCNGEEEEDYSWEDKYYEPDPSTSSSCYCSSNRYNCSDFRTQSEAQACYERCLLITGGDIHWLDDDDDGIACELNP